MIVIAGALGGALWGAYLARARKGRPADVAQYATAFGILGALLGLFATIAIERML